MNNRTCSKIAPILMIDYKIQLINDQAKFELLTERLASVSVFALDIETVDWWNRHQERISLIQIAYRAGGESKVAIIDAFPRLNLDSLRIPLEQNSITKIIHNAAFDAVRLANHYGFRTAPIYDTMSAARRNGEKRYSLKAQAQTHLNLHIDKAAQRSDWSRRPLDIKQLHYAALDAFAALLLYEHQSKRNLNGVYQLKQALDMGEQGQLPLKESKQLQLDILPPPSAKKISPPRTDLPQQSLTESSLALLGIIAELPTRYSPERLAVSVGTERVGLAGWIIDRILGRDADLDEETVKMEVADLVERKLIEISPSRRLEATTSGMNLWKQLKSA